MEVGQYNPSEIEPKWQKIWNDEGAFKAKQDYSLPKYYTLIEFPYPSAEGLHVGHPLSNTAMDIISRVRRMQGFNVMFPMGWDAFGLPTENFAIKRNIHPKIVTENNIKRFRAQLDRLGFSFDFSREVNTTDPSYYRWTQWIFLKLYEKGLAYKASVPINFCTGCKVGLANEEVVDGLCERCSSPVVRKTKSQWMLRITEYAQRLNDDLDGVNFLDKIKTQQRNWIGRSEGAEIEFPLAGTDDAIKVYTTRPDTVFGATYMVLSPEHPFVEKYADRFENLDEIKAYCEAAAHKSDFERTEIATDKTGVRLKGLDAVNVATGEPIPVWISDYVLISYGTGAIMAVPGHDQRDWEFARKFNLPVVEVIAGGDIEKEAYTDVSEGVLVNSGFLNELSVAEAKKAIIKWLGDKGIGKSKINFKLRDWVFSRQRYWGEPIPIIECDHCGFVPLKEDELPLMLPECENFYPGEDGESPLLRLTDWVNVPCPKCGKPARRETDTMPQWAGSSWYFLRYADPHCETGIASKEALDYWLPVDWYNGGMEHTTLHLLYSRFWHKFLFDIGVVPTPEPYQKRTSQGMILGETGEKMSKSRGNVINPDSVVDEIGADAFRMFEMFMGAFDQPKPWSQTGARGCLRFLERVWRLPSMLIDDDGIRDEMQYLINESIKKVSEDFERMKFNTAAAQMMTMVNEFYRAGGVTKGELKVLLTLLNPVCPHITEQMWESIGENGRLYAQSWPQHDASKLVKDAVELAVQVAGRVRARITVGADESDEEIGRKALADEKVAAALAGHEVKRVVVVRGRLVNIVT